MQNLPIHKAKPSIAAENKTDYSTFFAQAPNINPKSDKYYNFRVSIAVIALVEIEDKLMRRIRYLDKLFDKLAFEHFGEFIFEFFSTTIMQKFWCLVKLG